MYDKTKEVKNIQKTLLSKVKSACHDQGIPFIFLAAAADDGKKTEWVCDGIPAGEIDGLKLSDDRIRRALAILNGFEDELFEAKAAGQPKIEFEIDGEENIIDGIDDDEFNAGLVNEDSGDVGKQIR